MKKLVGLLIIVIICGRLIRAQEMQVNTGHTKIYYPNGKLLSEGFVIDGKPDGYWKTYYTTGIVKSEGNRKNFLLDSIWTFFNSVGDTTQKINYLYGKKNGYLYTYNTDRAKFENVGRVISREMYVNDSKEGKAFFYYDNGKLYEEVSYVHDKRDGICVEYEIDGRIISIKNYNKGVLLERERINRYNDNNQKEGLWKEFYPGMKLKSSANYTSGKLDGYYKEYNNEGTLILTLLYRMGNLVEDIPSDDTQIIVREIKDEAGRVIESGPYKNEIPIGIHKKFNEDGVIISSRVYNDFGRVISEGIINKEGKRTGDWKDYYSNTLLRAEGKYVNNLREGKWIFYFDNGVVEQTGKYLNGNEEGRWKWFYRNGDVWKEEEYNNGKLEGVYMEYDSTGKALVQGSYYDGEMDGSWSIAINDYTAQGKYSNSFKEGKWKYFYDDGILMFEGFYVQGNQEGEHRYYYPNGKIKEEQFYVNGIPDKHWKKYDENGTLILTVTYKGGMEYRINGVKIDLPYDKKIIIK